MAEKLSVDENTPAILERRSYYNDSGDVFEISLNTYPSEKYSYATRLIREVSGSETNSTDNKSPVAHTPIEPKKRSTPDQVPAIFHNYTTLLCDQPSENVLRVTLDRIEIANALNTQMGRDLHHLFTELLLNPGEYRCIILTGVGKASILRGGRFKRARRYVC